MKKLIIVLIGPKAVGKTTLARFIPGTCYDAGVVTDLAPNLVRKILEHDTVVLCARTEEEARGALNLRLKLTRNHVGYFKEGRQVLTWHLSR